MSGTKTIYSLVFYFALLVGVTGYPAACFAGFQASYSVTQNQDSPPTTITASSLSQKDKKESEALTFQIFNERYVPDSVRQKYNLPENWYDRQSPEISKPTMLIENSAVPNSAPISQSWRARRGENLRDILQRWSLRGEANLMWASTDVPILKKDFSFIGRYQDAVNALIKQEGGAQIHSQYRSEGLTPVMMEPASTVTTNSAPLNSDIKEEKTENTISKIFKLDNQTEKTLETRWFGLSGSPLAEVIQVWSEDANIRVIWNSEKNFALKETVSQVGHFEDAVFKALNQYTNDQIRPVGEMYIDPATGQRVLLVRTEVN